MPGSITPLPIMQLEMEEDRKRYEELEAPKSIVVRYGYLKQIAELPYDGKDKPGCGSKLVIMTKRGLELGEMLTTTCGNSGCGKSVSRKQMLQYIENSGGKDFPFTNQGRVVRVATLEDLQEQERLEKQKMPMIRFTKNLVMELGLPMKLVDIEWLLGGERIIFHYTSESWVDFRELVKQLAAEYQTRIEMHQVNARDEARLVADYEKCGQHCCCKQFLKVLKPVSMRSAKVQKATLDPTKISGRCGRLMCCLRYEDETYEDLRKRLPHRQTRVMTVDGPGTVIDSQILTQLILVVLDNGQPSSAYPLENLEILTRDHPSFRKPEVDMGVGGKVGPMAKRAPGSPPPPRREETRPVDEGQDAPREGGPEARDQNQDQNQDQRDRRGGGREGGREEGRDGRPSRGPRRPQPGRPLSDDQVESREGSDSSELPPDQQTDAPNVAGPLAGPVNEAPESDLEAMDDQQSEGPEGPGEGDTNQAGTDGEGQRKRRRRRRRRGRGGRGGEAGPSGSGGSPGPAPQ